MSTAYSYPCCFTETWQWVETSNGYRRSRASPGRHHRFVWFSFCFVFVRVFGFVFSSVFWFVCADFVFVCAGFMFVCAGFVFVCACFSFVY